MGVTDRYIPGCDTTNGVYASHNKTGDIENSVIDIPVCDTVNDVYTTRHKTSDIEM